MGTPLENSVFKFIASVFSEKEIPCVLVGGYALIAHKVQRMTFDVDIILTEKNFLKIENDIVNKGYKVFNKQKAFIQYRSTRKGFLDIDFLITDEDTIEILLKDSSVTTLSGETFIVPSPIHLIAMKLHSISNNKSRRSKDYLDILQLIRMNNIDPKNHEIEDLFETYDAEEIYKDLLDEQ